MELSMEEPGGYSPWGCKELDTTERLTLQMGKLQHRGGQGHRVGKWQE